ncbi:MAG: hypothetical protein IJ696_04885 [Ruminococcus sp.]|nr:hypothetical protein [Ruminococcus sp.]
MHDFGQAVLRKKHGVVTEYGALSGRGDKLYTVLTPKQEQELEDEAESEDEDMGMGGMT